MTHASAQRLLYEFLREELEPEERRHLEEHLASCARCTRELDELRSTIEALAPYAIDAALKRSDEFWKELPHAIERRLRDDAAQRTLRQPPRRIVLPWFFPPRRIVPALGGALAVVAVALLAWHLRTPVTPEADQSAILQPVLGTVSDRLAEYVRRSKILLVGLTNTRAPEGEPLDLSLERYRSQELLLAAREIPRDSLDGYSAMVVEDLKRVLVEIAAPQDASEQHQIELLRHSIRQQNLVFKLRMLEKLHVSPQTVSVRHEAR